MGWLRLSPAPPMEIGAEGASEDDDGQDEDVELQAARGPEPERRSVAEAGPPAALCGDSSLISIWFFRGPVEMFWMLYWLEEGEGEEEEGMEGAWVLVGELMGM